MRLWALVMFLTGSLDIGTCQWVIQSSGTAADLRGIHSLGNGIAWASGTEGTVLRTTNDGKAWQVCAVPPDARKLDFRGVQAFDEKTAIVMSSGPGGRSRLYKTIDGCHTWKLLFTNPDKDGFWDALNFYRGKNGPSRSSGILVGDPVNGSFAIFSTVDGGETWHRWGDDPGSRKTKARPGESLFAASNSSAVSPGINGQYAFVTGGKGGSRLLFEQGHSPFDASSWSAFSSSSVPLPSGDSSGASSIGRRASDDGQSGHFVIVGGDYSKPEVGSAAIAYQPAILIKVEIKSAKTPPHGYRSAVAYEAPTKTWITVGPNGTDISTDDGRNWHPLMPTGQDAPDADKNWNALSLPFVVGPHGRIGKLRTATPEP